MINLHFFISLISSIFVITSINPVHSVLWLVFVFINTSTIIIYSGIEFLGILFIIIYVGAIAVLFLFVIMMLNIKVSIKESLLQQKIPLVLFTIITFTYLFIVSTKPLLLQQLISNELHWFLIKSPITNIEAIGNVLYTIYFDLFIVVGIALLLAMVGAIMLTLKPMTQSKRQDLFKQISRSQNLFLYKKSK